MKDPSGSRDGQNWDGMNPEGQGLTTTEETEGSDREEQEPEESEDPLMFIQLGQVESNYAGYHGNVDQPVPETADAGDDWSLGQQFFGGAEPTGPGLSYSNGLSVDEDTNYAGGDDDDDDIVADGADAAQVPDAADATPNDAIEIVDIDEQL